MTEQIHPIKAMANIERRLKSGNNVPVERCHITKEEFKAISDEMERLIHIEMKLILTDNSEEHY